MTLDRTQHLVNLLERNGGWIRSADAKAAVIIVVATALLNESVVPAFTLATIVGSRAHEFVGTLATAAATTFFLAVLLVTAVLLGAAVVESLRTLLSRVTRDHPRGHAYFGDIAKRPIHDLLAFVQTAPEQEIRAELAEQVSATSHIAVQKFAHANRALRLVIAALPFAVLLTTAAETFSKR